MNGRSTERRKHGTGYAATSKFRSDGWPEAGAANRDSDFGIMLVVFINVNTRIPHRDAVK